ncbi:hypothetical protein BDZ45DRAFT_676551 [Acephala macrosclerotiorum]|nr:hypothetical protein BDZ45DRAFT_676551 [Acephala macrosclerotiorum]
MAPTTSNADSSSHRAKRQRTEEPTFKHVVIGTSNPKSTKPSETLSDASIQGTNNPCYFRPMGLEPQPKEFMVHKEVACYYSTILGAAFNSTFIEGQPQRYTFEDTAARAVRLLVQWMYGRKLHLIQALDGSDGPLSTGLSIEARESEDMSLVEL